jgi:glycosyltransferase involved in cell wall biosynthesis
MEQPKISVVIPSAGERSDALKRAVDSVANQTLAVHEVIVVFDIDSIDAVPDFNFEIPVQTLVTGTKKSGAAKARNIGIAHSTGDWIALLDDDDRYHLNKLEKQFDLIKNESTTSFVLSCRFNIFDENDQLRETQPRRLPYSDESIVKYLFGRQNVWSDRTYLATPTLVFPRSIAIETPFNESMPKLEDIDFLVNVSHKCKLVMSDSILVDVTVRDVGGLSNLPISDSFRTEWAMQTLRPRGKKLTNNFILFSSIRAHRKEETVRFHDVKILLQNLPFFRTHLGTWLSSVVLLFIPKSLWRSSRLFLEKARKSFFLD